MEIKSHPRFRCEIEVFTQMEPDGTWSARVICNRNVAPYDTRKHNTRGAAFTAAVHWAEHKLVDRWQVWAVENSAKLGD